MTSSNFQNITLADGTWKYKEVEVLEWSNDYNETSVLELTITKSGTTITLTGGSTYTEGRVPAGTPQSEISQYEALGYVIDGDHYTYSHTMNSNDIANIQADIDTYLDDHFDNFRTTYSGATLKKNADNTKFYSKYSVDSITVNGQPATSETTTWLMKN